MPIKLVFEGMNAEEILEEIKKLFGPHFVGQVTEKVTENNREVTTIEVGDPTEPVMPKETPADDESTTLACKKCGTTDPGFMWRAKTLPHGPLCNACGQKDIKARKKTGNKKETGRKTSNPKTGYTCRLCSVTETSLWRGKKDEQGPLCNACYLKERRPKKPIKAPKKEKTPQTPRRRVIKTNYKPVKGKRLQELQQQETKATATSEPVMEESTDNTQAFGTWIVDSLRRSIFDPQGFIIGGTLLQGWYKAQHGNDTSGMNTWLAANSASYLVKIQAAFALFQKKLPTAISLQESEGNPMLVVLDPSKVTSDTIPSEGELREVFTNE